MRITLQISSPFKAPVYYKETVSSTMDEARSLADIEHGTVIAADYQTAGRGRSGRPWRTDSGESLSFTVILRYGAIETIPRCLTLRTGLAVSYAVEDFAALIGNSQTSPLAGKVRVKWPNDLMLLDTNGQGRKAAGILTETTGTAVYTGIGVNIAQRHFPPELAGKACSIAQALSHAAEPNGAEPDGADAAEPGSAETALAAEKRFTLLEMILSRLYRELETDAGGLWRKRLEDRLYLKGRNVCFIPGLPDGPESIEGILEGIGEEGELLITTAAGRNLSFVSGELRACRGDIAVFLPCG